MSYPAYTQQPYPQNHYNPNVQPQYAYGNQPQYHPNQQHQQGPYPYEQPQIIYREQPHSQSRWNDPNTCWLISLLTLCCGCFIGQEFCDSNVCCCLIPCALPRFR